MMGVGVQSRPDDLDGMRADEKAGEKGNVWIIAGWGKREIRSVITLRLCFFSFVPV
jgi:hypothetical protein